VFRFDLLSYNLHAAAKIGNCASNPPVHVGPVTSIYRLQSCRVNAVVKAVVGQRSLFQSKDEPEGSEGLAKWGFLSFCD
jgi:hypothetical protein